MIEAKQVHREVIPLGELEGIAHKHLHADRNVAHPDKAAEVGMTAHRFGHHAGRIGEVNQPGIRAKLFDVVDDVEDDRNGA